MADANAQANIIIKALTTQAEKALKQLGKGFGDACGQANKLGKAGAKMPGKMLGGIKKVSDSLTKMKGSLKDTFEKLKDTKMAHGVKNIASYFTGAINQAKKFFGTLGSIKGALLAIGATVGLIKLAQGFQQLAQEAGQVQQSRVIFENLANSIRQVNAEFAATYPNAEALMSSLKEASQGMLSMAEIAQISTKAFSMMGAEVGTRLPEIFKAATTASILTGKSVEKAVQAILSGSARLYNAYFQQIGLVVDLKDAYAIYADTANRSVDSLTRQEKSAAALDYTLGLLEKRALAMGDTTALLSIRTQQLNAMWSDMKDGLLTKLAPAFTVIQDVFLNFFNTVLPVVESFINGFLAQIYRVGPEMMRGMSDGMTASSAVVDQGAQEMGGRAAQWATDALTWGANVGSQFAIGIMEGFTAAITFVLNTISSILNNWFAPGSPPKIVPDIDKWGAAAGEEFVGGMADGVRGYTPGFKAILDALQKQFAEKPQQKLLEWGVSAIASWAKGLSIFDLELMEKKSETELKKATDIRDQLKTSLEKQRRELFEMQVLQKDPGAIRNKLKEVKASKRALNAQEREVAMLKKRHDMIKAQLQLFKLLDRILKKTESGGGGGDGGGAGGLAKALGFGGGGGGFGIADKIKGFAATLGGIFDEPLQNMKDSWETNLGKITTAWDTFVLALETSGILAYLTDPAWAQALGLTVGLGIAIAILATVIGAVVSPLGLLLTGLLLLAQVASVVANERAPTLAKQLTLPQKALLLVGYAAEAAQTIFVGAFILIEIAVLNVIVGIQNLAVQMRDFFAAIREDSGAVKIFDGIVESSGNAVAAMQGHIGDLSESTGQYSEMVAEVEADMAAAELDFEIESIPMDDLSLMPATVMTQTDQDLSTMVESFNKAATDVGTPLDTIALDAETFATDTTSIFTDTIPESLGDMSVAVEEETGAMTTSFEESMTAISTTVTETLPPTTTLVEEQTGAMSAAFDTVSTSVSGLKSLLEDIHNWLGSHTLTVEIEYPDPPPSYMDDLTPHSPPPLAQGIAMVNQEAKSLVTTMRALTGMRGGGGVPDAGIGRDGAGGPSQVVIEGPLVENMIVPNQRVGKQTVRQLATELGNMITVRRQPA